MLYHLLKTKIRILYHSLTDFSFAGIVRHFGSLAVFGGFAFGSYHLTRVVLAALLDRERVGLALIHQFISMGLFVFFMSVNVGNLIVSYASLYRSQETEYFLAKPVDDVTLFLLKYIENFFFSSATMFIISMSVLGGYASHFGLGWPFIVRSVLFLFLPLTSIAATLAVLSLLGSMQLVGKIGVMPVLLLFAGVYGVLTFGYFESSNPMDVVTAFLEKPLAPGDLIKLPANGAAFIPSTWAADALYWAAMRNPTDEFKSLFLLNGAAVAGIVLMVVVAGRTFREGWLTSATLRSANAVRSLAAKPFSLLRRSRGDSQVSVLLRKECWMFVREPSQWIHSSVLVLLVIAFVFSISKLEFHSRLPFYRSLTFLSILLFDAFLIASIALRFVYPMVNTEGLAFWAVLAAPISRTKVYYIKLASALGLMLAVSLVLLVYSGSVEPGLMSMSALLLAGVSILLVALNLTAGIIFSDFREKNPIKIASSQSATLTFLAGIAYLTMMVAFVFFPVVGYFEHQIHGTPFDPRSSWMMALSFFMFSTAAFLGAVALGRKSIAKDF